MISNAQTAATRGMFIASASSAAARLPVRLKTEIMTALWSDGAGAAARPRSRQRYPLRFLGASFPDTVRRADFFGITEARLVLPSLGA